MNKIRSDVGVFIILAGVAVLCLYGFGCINSFVNLVLIAGLILIFSGIIVFIFMNKRTNK